MLESAAKMLDKEPIIFAVDGVQVAYSKNSMGGDIAPMTILSCVPLILVKPAIGRILCRAAP
jgi:hypothetical protein